MMNEKNDVLTEICNRTGEQENGLPLDSVADYYTF